MKPVTLVLVIVLVLASAAAASAQPSRVYTPDTPAAANATTILNTTVVSVDAAARTITVRADEGRDGVVDRDRTRVLRVSDGAVASLRDLAPGTGVLLTLKGGLVADVKRSGPAVSAPGGAAARTPQARRAAPRSTGKSAPPAGPTLMVSPAPGVSPDPPPAAGGTRGRAVPQLPPAARTPQSREIPQLPAGATDPRARTLPQVPPAGTVTPAPAISPVTQVPRPAISPVTQSPRPAISPVSMASPRSPGTPPPVVLPSDPPPTPMPSPGP